MHSIIPLLLFCCLLLLPIPNSSFILTINVQAGLGWKTITGPKALRQLHYGSGIWTQVSLYLSPAHQLNLSKIWLHERKCKIRFSPLVPVCSKASFYYILHYWKYDAKHWWFLHLLGCCRSSEGGSPHEHKAAPTQHRPDWLIDWWDLYPALYPSWISKRLTT